MKGMLRGVLFCPLQRGKSGAARIGGGERSEPVSRIVFMSFDTESKLRNADFISIAAEQQSATLGAKGPVSRVDGIRLLCPPLTEPYVRFSRIRLLE